MTRTWLHAALVRAVRTVAQTAVALIGTSALGVLDVDWIAVTSASALAGIVSVLTSVAGLPEAAPPAVVATGIAPPTLAELVDRADERVDPATVPDPDEDDGEDPDPDPTDE